MPELRFDNRVAVITGAGRGLGRAYALLLGSRGAKVVVNDLGVTIKGEGGVGPQGKDGAGSQRQAEPGPRDPSDDLGPAEEVAREIRSAGGQAVACTDSVATPQGGKAIIQSALDNFGRIDIVIHNAGIVRRAGLDEMSYEDFEQVLDVHLRGAFHVVRPAFPLMCKSGYGRMVLTSSINGLYGNAKVANYSVAKAGTIALSNTVALEGAAHGVKCNAIIPAAVTRMAEGLDTSAYPPMTPDMVAPLVGWLAHESCSISGEMLISIAGRVARAFVAESRGVYRDNWSIEEVSARMDAIRSTDNPLVFPTLPSGHIDHLRYSFEMAKAKGA